MSVHPLLEALDPRLRAALQGIGIEQPTEIQEIGWNVLADDQADALLVAPTGTGKTEAALVPLLQQRLTSSDPQNRVVYVTPLRALNRDMEQRMLTLTRGVGLTAGVRHGDTSTSERSQQVRRPPDLLITTPETLPILFTGHRLRTMLGGVRTVVVDEVHELFGSDRGAQLALTLERLDAELGRPLRRIGLSATVSNPNEVARFLSPAPRKVRVGVAQKLRLLGISVRPGTDSTAVIPPDLEAELKADAPYLKALLAVEEEVRRHHTTLVFVNTRPTAEGLAARLARLAPDLTVAVHHGSLSRVVREEAEKSFREGSLRALIATSSLELGIDIGAVDAVVQFGSPHQAGRLVQRVGRSGHRIGREVRGTLLALDDEDLEECAVIGRRALAREIEPIRWRTKNRLAAAQAIIATLRADRTADPTALWRLLAHATCLADLTESEWNELVQVLDQLRSLRLDAGALKPTRGTLERFYATLSLIPDQKTYRLRDIATRRPIGTLDERFVVANVLGQPEQIFLLHGRTWKVVEFREEELLVEAVAEIGQEPRWYGEDLPVPFEAAMEIGRLRREGDLEQYPLTAPARSRLAARLALFRAAVASPTDQTVTVTVHERIVVIGACFGTRTNATLALLWSGELTERLGAKTEILEVEPTWIVLNLPVSMDGEGLLATIRQSPVDLEVRFRRAVVGSPEFRYVFLTVARKLGILPVGSDPRALRDLEPLIESQRTTPVGEEAIDKTLFDRFDLEHAEEVLRWLGDGTLSGQVSAENPATDSVLARLRWRELSDTPPPTLLAAVGERLRHESRTLVCLRCGFLRNVTAATYTKDGGSVCRICHGSLSAIFSPRREAEIEMVRKYAQRKWKGQRAARKPPTQLEPTIRAAYITAELLAHHGATALLALAGRGVGPDAARRLLARPYRQESELITEILRTERNYARTRAFWD
jgi:ATP-dependent Lhr-like helicase